MAKNKRRISLREGELFVNGIKVIDSIKCEVVFTPEVTESRALKERGLSRRWIAYDITGNITEYRSTPWLRKAAADYIKTGATPEYTLSAIQNDTNSDYYDANGNIKVTLSGVVLTGDIPLISLDSEGELMQDEIEFGAVSMT